MPDVTTPTTVQPSSTGLARAASESCKRRRLEDMENERETVEKAA
jgi:hypothetical protein